MDIDRTDPGLPLGIQAAGSIGPSGEPMDLIHVQQTSRGYLTGDGRLYEKLDLSGERQWYRAPFYFSQIQIEQRDKLEPFFLSSPDCSNSEEITDCWQAIHGTEALSSFASVPAELSLTELFPKNLQEISTIEQSLINGEIAAADDAMRITFAEQCHHPRILFARAAIAMQQHDYSKALRLFHFAALLGHPLGFDAELAATSKLSQTFLQNYPHIAESFSLNEPLRALTLLRAIKAEHPLFANIFLAHALRFSPSSDEGLQSCKVALQQEQYLPDVYGYQWEYHFHRNELPEAAEVAATHLRHYPFNPRANLDALDTSVTLGDSSLAFLYSHLSLIFSVNVHTALKNLFKYYELTRNWETLKRYFDALTPCARALTPETLRLYGEVCVECNAYDEALPKLEQAMAASPEDAEAVLAYARAFAKSGDLASATKLIESVLHDPSRNDSTPGRFLLLAMLSELYRNSDRLDNAMSIWPETSEFNEELLALVGPRPFVEYAYCLAEANMVNDALKLQETLERDYGSLFIVQELREKLSFCFS